LYSGLFRQGLDDHIGEELFAWQEWEEVFEGLGDEAAVFLLVGREAWGADFVGKHVDVAEDRAGHGEDLSNFGGEVGLVLDDRGAEFEGLADGGEIGDGEAGVLVGADRG
jgi:hypothetical protein